MTTVWAFLKAVAVALPEVLRLLKGVQDYALLMQGKQVGYATAVKDAFAVAAKAVALAQKVDVETDIKHQDPTDGAFDPDFQRPEP